MQSTFHFDSAVNIELSGALFLPFCFFPRLYAHIDLFSVVLPSKNFVRTCSLEYFSLTGCKTFAIYIAFVSAVTWMWFNVKVINVQLWCCLEQKHFWKTFICMDFHSVSPNAAVESTRFNHFHELYNYAVGRAPLLNDHKYKHKQEFWRKHFIMSLNNLWIGFDSVRAKEPKVFMSISAADVLANTPHLSQQIFIYSSTNKHHTSKKKTERCYPRTFSTNIRINCFA